MDVCLYFNPDFPPTGSGKREIARDEVEAILEEARSKRLVPRPFRNEKDEEILDGICFCCDDCCYFKARSMVGGELIIDEDKCYGCGLCVDACPTGCISFTNR